MSVTATRCVWDDIVGQPRVVTHLRESAREETVSHAYLFVGPPGAGKKTAARAFACALLCDDEGCGGCSACARVKRDVHPDVHMIEPEGAASYVVGQVREVVHDVSLTPIEATRKVYVLSRADSFNPEAANALLKTLEEPPDDVVMILLSSSVDAVLPTILSRCQVVRFDRIPPGLAARILMERTGVNETDAVAALAAAGGILPRAVALVRSPTRVAARESILSTLKDLGVMDGLDVTSAVKSLMASVRAPLDEIREAQQAELEERRALLGKSGGSTKALEERHKRQLTAKEREGLLEILNVTESWLRDCLALSQGAGELVQNRDRADAMAEVATVLAPEAAVRGLGAVGSARRRISYNVSPQLALEAMLFDIREVLRCPR